MLSLHSAYGFERILMMNLRRQVIFSLFISFESIAGQLEHMPWFQTGIGSERFPDLFHFINCANLGGTTPEYD